MYMQPHLSFMDNILSSHCTCISNLIIDWSLNFTSSTKYNVPLKKKNLSNQRDFSLLRKDISYQILISHLTLMTVSDVSLSYSCKHDDLRVQPAFSSILEDYEFQYNHVFKLNSITALISILHFS